MKPIIIVMLCVQVAIFLAVTFAVALRKPTGAKPRPIWSSLAVSLFIVGMTSMQIGGGRTGQTGADILLFGGPLLIGMAVMCLLVLIRERRGVAAQE